MPATGGDSSPATTATIASSSNPRPAPTRPALTMALEPERQRDQVGVGDARRTTADGIQRVVAATVERFGGVDVLVNNSGGPAPGKLPSLTDDDWRRGFEVVTLNFVRFVREVVPQSNGIRPGVAGLMKAVMPELARDGITINLVLPGIVLTDRIRHSPAGPGGADDATIQAHVTAGIPLGRLGEPAEVGQLVAFLSSEQAGYITGAVYQIDGGIIRSNL